jgi:hypothetical protein
LARSQDNVSEWGDQLGNFTAISWREQVNFQLDDVDEVHFVLSQHAYLDLYSASSLKQQSFSFQRHRWCNGWRAHLECGRSWVRAPIGSNQRL